MTRAWMPMRPSALALRSATILFTVLLTIGLFATASWYLSRGSAPDFEDACRTGGPYYVTAAYRAQVGAAKPPSRRAPSVILFQDTANNKPQYAIAEYEQTGAVWGLAYRRSERAVYAAAYRKRSLPFGPLGPGGIYRIDLQTGDVTPFLTVPDAGNSRGGVGMADGSREHDPGATREVGKTALGDIDLSADETQLFVMNLESRKIYRYSMPDGTLLGSFDHGAAAASWANDARPFALAYHRGYLYHGVLNSHGSGSSFAAQIYRSKPDGSEMTEVSNLGLGYTRDSVKLRNVSGGQTRWRAWNDDAEERAQFEEPQMHQAQPMLTDITFTPADEMVIALRDRYWDLRSSWIRDEAKSTAYVNLHDVPPNFPTQAPPDNMAEEGLGFGDILLGTKKGARYDIETSPEHFDDTNAVRHEESAFGGLACVVGTTKIAATMFGVEKSSQALIVAEEGAYWYDVPTGNRTGLESVGQPVDVDWYSQRLRQSPFASAHTHTFVDLSFEFFRDIGSLGDVETLCGACTGDGPTPPPTAAVTFLPPTDTPTVPPDTPVPPPDTPIPPTPTPTPTNTPTPTPTPTNTPTATPTPTPGPIYLPILVREHCDPSRVQADVVLVIDASTSMEGAKFVAAKAAAVAFIDAMNLSKDQVGVVAFNEAATIVSPLSGDRAALVAAIERIALVRGTHIDTGLAAARQVLAGPERIPANTPVVVLLTDGIQVGPLELPHQLADQFRAEKVELFVVGLGTDLDAAYLARLAGDADRLYLAPTPEELKAIYERIARLIPCPPGAFWGGR